MMPHQWLYDGELDTPTTVSCSRRGASMSDEGMMALYRDVIQFQSDDQRS